MRLDVVLPAESVTLGWRQLQEIARAADALGYHTAWLPDHILPPGAYGPAFGGVYEPLVTLGYLAGTTTSIRLGTSVLVLPMRNPFVVAKQVATIDRLSDGRAVLGVGIGWVKEEFAAVHADYATRAARTDEAIALIRHLFSGAGGPFAGEYYGYQRGVFEPRPAGQIPIMVGGGSDAALLRAGRLADIWQGFAMDAGTFAARAAFLRDHTDRRVEVGTRIEWHGPPDDVDDVVREALSFRDAGAEHLAIHFGDADGYPERMATAMHAIKPALKPQG